jgi:methionyl aminopeptidase
MVAVTAPVSSPPVRPGVVAPSRPVPAHIPRPPYVATGDPGPARSPLVRSRAEIRAMRRAGALAAQILLDVAPLVRPGVSTDTIDAFVHDRTVAAGAYPSPLGYLGFPKSVCTSVNEVICHGIPDSRPLRDGDIVNVDVTVFLDGVHGDTSVTFPVGEVDSWSLALVRETRVAMDLGIAAIGAGAPVSVIGAAIEGHAREHGLGVVTAFLGHAIGTEFHGQLSVPHHFDRRARTRLQPGTTITVEPMLALGSPEVLVWDDDWTAVTEDGRRSAQFEHTVLVTDAGAEILTVTADGTVPADVLGLW